jgi:hypothetical protein
MTELMYFIDTLVLTIRDVLPILGILIGFQLFVLRRKIPHLKSVVIGFVFVLFGLTFFLLGLEKALFPLGKLMAEQLTDPQFLGLADPAVKGHWMDYSWVYLFAFAIGFSTTIAEPSLLAVAIKAQQVSGGAIAATGLRVAVALGVAIGIAIGSYRIVSGTPLTYYIIGGYIVVIIQTVYAPKMITALAYDSGGVTTSTVTVPLVAALGLGLSHHVPGSDPLLDGFGLIAFASLFPIMAVLGYAQIGEWQNRKQKQSQQQGDK